MFLLLLLSLAALWQGADCNAIFPSTEVGWHSPDIIYKIGDMSKFTFTEKHVREGLAWIEENTCINFIDQRTVPDREADFRILPGVNCSVHDKYFEIGQCIGARYFVVHETMHWLGFYHTHNRPDWKEYIKVIPGMESYFDYMPAKATPVVAYDLGSGMHYSYRGVALPLNAEFADTMGQTVRIAFSDYYSINWLFNCSGKCTSQPKCENGGYTHPRDCNKCMCNKYYIGDLCETPRNLVKLSCEGQREYSRLIEWPGNYSLYPKKIWKDDFMDRRDDVWDIIEAPEHLQIEVEILSKTGYKPQRSSPCSTASAEVNDGDFNLVGKMYCDGPNAVPRKFIAKSNRLGYHAEYATEVYSDINAKFTLLGCDAPAPPTTTTTTALPTVPPTTTTTTNAPATTTSVPQTTTTTTEAATTTPASITTTYNPATTTTAPQKPVTTTTAAPPGPTTTTTAPPVVTTTTTAKTEQAWCDVM